MAVAGAEHLKPRRLPAMVPTVALLVPLVTASSILGIVTCLLDIHRMNP
jgi:hypothetical protein